MQRAGAKRPNDRIHHPGRGRCGGGRAVTLKAFLAGCWWSHEHIRERVKGKYYLVCERCGDRQEILSKQKLRVKAQNVVRFQKRKRA